MPLRLVHITSLPSSIAFVIRSASYTILCLSDGTLLSINEINHVQRMKPCVLSRNLTGLWWIIDDLLFALADEQGAIVFYDIALNPIWPVLSSYKKLNFYHQLNLEKSIVAIHQLFNPNPSSSNLTLLLQFSQGGPIGLIDLHYPLKNIHSLLKFYLTTEHSSHLIDLVWCLDWTRQDHDCRLAASMISQECFRNFHQHQNEFYLEQLLRTFYSPLRPISDASILRNRAFINQIATRFFYHLLKGKFYSKALQLAKHLDSRTIYLDLYYACDQENEKTIMNVCAQHLHRKSDSDTENDDESGLSVTSSEDETPTERTSTRRYPSMQEKPYGDINEILTSAIEHYKLDENMYKFLLDRIHAM